MNMHMDVKNIFNQVSALQVGCVGYIVQEPYPLLFFSLLLQKQTHFAACLDVTQQSEVAIKATLETSFLGMISTYRLAGLQDLSKQVAQQWLRYLSMYQGPNRIVFVVSHEIAEPYIKNGAQGISCVDIPAQIQKATFIDLFEQVVRTPTPIERRYIEQLYMRSDKIPLDTACMLMRYLQVLGSHAQEFFATWIDKLVLPDKSLFLLSQLFFARQATQFLQMWAGMRDQYPEQFWISFWSEQVWRALFYCKSMQQRDVANAKKIGYRLPFSFLQKDYRTCSIESLQIAHETLYELDVKLKNGGSVVGLDLFFLSYFAQ